MDRLLAMQTFVRVVETGSFSAVAREQQTTQSAVSKQVAGLEKHLGARLLNRSTRSLALTDEGEIYFEQAQRLVAEFTEAETLVRSGQSQLNGPVRLAAAVGFGRLKLLPLLQTFLRQHPQLQVDLRLHDGFVDLIGQGVDLAVRVGHLRDSNLVARRVGISKRLLVAHQNYVRNLPSGLSEPAHPQDLLRHNCLVYTELSSVNAWTFSAGPNAQEPLNTQCQVRVNGSLKSNSSEFIRAAIMQGMGIGYAPEWLFENELASGELKILLPDWQAPAVPINLISPPQRLRSTKVRVLSDFLAENLGLPWE